MKKRIARIRQIFAKAIEIRNPVDRTEYLDQECNNDSELREEVAELLKAHDAAGSFLGREDQTRSPSPTGSNKDANDRSKSQMVFGRGTIISQYKLLQPIGAGGMGAVWMAEQEEPVRRRVALKLILGDIGSPDIIARFEAERQALAMMEHPNIARVFDAGTTDSGTPWFVMELVKGISITKYCDENKLGIKERLELMVAVCHAVQHAHQKGIVHRDLKPSNVLVTKYDGVPVPKVIDFGLAKALDHQTRLTDKSFFTEFNKVVGTLQYMSPEQAEFSARDVDTRTDIYSLGVLLYELLTGTTPIETSTLEEKAVLQVLAMIKEIEPPRPSKRLSQFDDAITAVSERRKIDPSKLIDVLRGELDWVVMKSLEADKKLRYQTAYSLAGDIENYLNGNVISARPPSAIYRVQKFIRRNQTIVAAGSLIALALIAGIVASTFATIRAHSAEKLAATKAKELASALDLAKSEYAAKQKALDNEIKQRQFTESVTDFVVNDLLSLTSVEGQSLNANSDQNEPAVSTLNKDTTLTELLDRAAEKLDGRNNLDPATEARLRSIIGSSYRANGQPNKAIPFLRRALELSKQHLGNEHPTTLMSSHNLANCYAIAGQPEKSLPIMEDTLELQRTKLGEQHPNTLNSMNSLAIAYHDAGQPKKSLDLLKQALKLSEASLGADHPKTLNCMNSVAAAYFAVGEFSNALPLMEKSLKRLRVKHGSDDFRTLSSMLNLGLGYKQIGELKKAKSILESSYDGLNSKFGAKHPTTISCANNLAIVYVEAGQIRKAMPLMKTVLESRKQTLGPQHPDSITAMTNLAGAFRANGQHDKALPLLEDAYKSNKLELGEKHPKTITSLSNLTAIHFELGDPDSALPLAETSLELCRDRLGPNHPQTLNSLNTLGTLYSSTGKTQRSITVFEELLSKMKMQLGDHHPTTLNTLANLSWGYIDVERFDDAIVLLEDSLQHLPQSSRFRWNILNGLRTAYLKSGKDKFADRANQDLQLARKEFEPGSLQLAEQLASIGLDLLTNGDYELSIEALRDSLSIRKQKNNSDWKTFNTQSALGGALLGKVIEAERKKVKTEANQDKPIIEISKTASQDIRPLLESGLEGLKQNADEIPKKWRNRRLIEALDRLIKLEKHTGNKIGKWQEERRSLSE